MQLATDIKVCPMDKLLSHEMNISYYPKIKEAIDGKKNLNLSMSRKITPREGVIILHFGYHHNYALCCRWHKKGILNSIFNVSEFQLLKILLGL